MCRMIGGAPTTKSLLVIAKQSSIVECNNTLTETTTTQASMFAFGVTAVPSMIGDDRFPLIRCPICAYVTDSFSEHFTLKVSVSFTSKLTAYRSNQQAGMRL